MRLSLLLSLGLALLCAGRAFGHDPYEITTEAWLRPKVLELEVTMARSTAMAVLSGDRDSAPFDPAKFESLKPKFEEQGRRMFAITVNGAALAAPVVKVELTVESDLTMRLTYPRPPAGELRLQAPHVAKLGYGYGNVFTAHGDGGALLEQKMLTETEPALLFTIAPPPAIAAPPAPPSASAPPAAPAPGPKSVLSRKRYESILAGITVSLIAAALGLRRRRRPRAEPGE